MMPRRAQGYPIGGGRRRIAVTLFDDTFGQIQARALKGGVSFNEELATLVEWALEACDRWEGDERAADRA